MSQLLVTVQDAKAATLTEVLRALDFVESVEEQGGQTFPRQSNGSGRENNGGFYQDPRTPQMEKEAVAYDAMREEIVEQYLGQHVAVFQGKVVDHDADPGALVDRLNEHYPDDVVLMRKVRETPRPPFRMRSPRLVRD